MKRLDRMLNEGRLGEDLGTTMFVQLKGHAKSVSQLVGELESLPDVWSQLGIATRGMVKVIEELRRLVGTGE